MDNNKFILLTIDVEDWFQVENFRPWLPIETWDKCELRVERNVHKLLNLFDSIELKAQSSQLKADRAHSLKLTVDQTQSSKLAAKNQKNDYELSAISSTLGHNSRPKATFFVLGWIAERLPNLIREIHSRGHEVASHGYNHNLCNQQSHYELKKELTQSKKILEDTSGSQVFGCRAPNFSVNDDILKIIEDCGYLYDSSYNSFSLNARYGKISLNGRSKRGIARQISDNFLELPISNLTLRNLVSYACPVKLFRKKHSEANVTGGQSPASSERSHRNRFVLPWGGGAYFRLVPFSLFSFGVKNILTNDGAYLFYIHPWEIDLHQPRLSKASFVPKLRHYTNLGQTEQKLAKLIKHFRHCGFIDCCQYLKRLLPGHN